MASEEQNALLSKQKSDSDLQVALHPLVLLTISDYITRHTLRQQHGPVVGALLGQQHGREITIEHAFDCLLEEHNEQIILSAVWFDQRLQAMKEVHKATNLDLVGWYTILPLSGPQAVHVPIQSQIGEWCESPLFLGFHPASVLEKSSGGKLPLTLYEPIYEAEESHEAGTGGGEDREMKDSGPTLQQKWREIPYNVETGEAEMISVDFVARGGGNATAVDGAAESAPSASAVSKGKMPSSAAWHGDGKPVQKKKKEAVLSGEEEALIAALTAKINAIKMLHSRIELITAYLQQLPKSYTSPAGACAPTTDAETTAPPLVNHSILRSIQALLTRLSLLVPADSIAFERELKAEHNDVSLVSMLSSMTESIKDVRQTGRKYSMAQQGKKQQPKANDRERIQGWAAPITRGAGGIGSHVGAGISGVGDLASTKMARAMD